MYKIKISILIIFLLLLSGCYGGKNIQQQTIITSIGIDYNNGMYTVMIEALNFSNVAKQEGASATPEPLPPLIGEATDKSIQAALDQLNKKAALPLFYGLVNNIIITKNVIEKKMDEVVPYLSQKSVFRNSTWLFGTENDLKSIFNSDVFFNLPNTFAIYHTPTHESREPLNILSLKYNRFISRYYEPIGTILIPSLSIDENQFEEKVKRKIAYINGVYALEGRKFKGFADVNSIKGKRWLYKNKSLYPIELTINNASIEVLNINQSIKVTGKKKPIYKIKIKAKGIVDTNLNQLDQQKLEKEFSKEIRKEINQTIHKSKELNVDLLDLNDKAFKFYSKKWGPKILREFDESSIKLEEVKVHIDENMTYK